MIKRYQDTRTSQYLIVILLLISIILTGFISAYFMQRISFDDAFVIPWAAGRAWLFEATDPYTAEISGIANKAISESDYQAVVPDGSLQLPFLDLIFYLPFSLVPYTISRILWVTLSVICIMLIGYFSFLLSDLPIKIPGKTFFLLLILLWVPGITTAVMGKLFPFVLLLLLISTYLFMIGQDTAAGFILSLTFGSITWSILPIIFLLIYAGSKRRWPLIFSFLSGLAFITIISILLLPSWPRDWLTILLDNYSNMELFQTPLMALAKRLPGIEDFLAVFLHGLFGIFFIILVITSRSKSRQVFIWNMLSVLIIAYLLNVQGTIHAIYLIFPGIFLVMRFLFERWGLIGKIFSYSFMLLLAVGSWFLYLPIESFSEPITIPLLTIGLPILIFIGMLWIRWWALKIPRLTFEVD